MKGFIQSFFSAFRFFTVLPLPDSWCGDLRALGGSVRFFPIVGLAVGAALAVSDWAFVALFHSPQVAAALDIALLAALTKALHIDGLCDTADGFLSSRPKAKMLEIMRDSRVGAMGVTVLVAVLLIKWTVLSSLSGETRFYALLLMPAAGRCALVFLLQALPYAREEGGLASVFKNGNNRFCLVWSAIFLFALSFASSGSAGLVAASAVCAATVVFGFVCVRKIGGFTGDTLGASVEIAELVTVCALLACVGRC